MQVKVKLRELGSSFGIILSKTIMELLDAKVGQFINVKVGNNDFSMRKVIKIGSSQGLIITRLEVDDLGIRDGHYLNMKLENKKLVITNNDEK